LMFNPCGRPARRPVRCPQWPLANMTTTSDDTTAGERKAAQVALGNTSEALVAGCALIVWSFEVAFPGAPVSGFEPNDYFLTVDGDEAGAEGGYELTVVCELIMYPSQAPTALPSPPPTPAPSPQPSVTPNPSSLPVLNPTPVPSFPPSPVPTAPHARSNCACFSGRMIENVRG